MSDNITRRAALGGIGAFAILPRQGKAATTPDWSLPGVPVQGLLMEGQSNASNNSEGAEVCLPAATRARVPDRCLMLQTQGAPGIKPRTPFTSLVTSGLVPLQDCQYGNHATAAYGGNARGPLGQSLSTLPYFLDANAATQGRPLRRMVYSALGQPGQPLSVLSKGVTTFFRTTNTRVDCYDTTLKTVARISELCRKQYNQRYEIRMLGWRHREAEYLRGTTREAYTAAARRLFQNKRADYGAITGQASFPILTETPAGNLNGMGNVTCLSDYDLHDPTNGVYCIGPSYGEPFNANDDGVGTAHRTAVGALMAGEKFARALLAIEAGGEPKWLRVGTVRRFGRDMVDFFVVGRQGTLQVDTSQFAPMDENLGWTAHSANGGRILKVQVLGDRVRLTLTAGFLGEVSYAYQYPGALEAGGRTGTNWNGLADLGLPFGLGRDTGPTGGPAPYSHPVAPLPARTPPTWGNIRDQYEVPCRTLLASGTLKSWLHLGRWTIPQT